MNFVRIVLAALGAFVAYFAVGGLAFAALPWLKDEFLKYPAVYRSQEGIKSVMPVGMAAMFVAILALAVIYALLYHGGSGIAEGARFGALIGIVVGTALGAAFAAALKQQGITDVVIPGSSLVIFLVLSVVLGLGAASWPARRAAKLDVLRAIATD